MLTYTALQFYCCDLDFAWSLNFEFWCFFQHHATIT